MLIIVYYLVTTNYFILSIVKLSLFLKLISIIDSFDSLLQDILHNLYYAQINNYAFFHKNQVIF